MAVTQMQLETLAEALGQAIQSRGWMLTLAESCTGGWAAQVVTAIPGSSAWFDRGYVTYSNASKTEMLGVRPETLARFGAVSAQTVAEMAEGGRPPGSGSSGFPVGG